ncbi:MAG: Pycsar system effector family protein [Nocardioidaceae bacterium]
MPALAINSVSVSIENQNGLLEEKEKYKKHKSNSSERTIETMFRTTSSNSQRLSSQADTKAHILISVNSIIISVLLSVVVTRMADYSRLTIPVIMLLLVNLITISFSILATRPNIPRGIFDEDELKQNKVNLLFFGNFFKMKFDDYSNFMQQVMGDQQILYVTMLRNLHEQGLVLGKKYRLLKTAYNFFMYGLIISVITFFIVSKFMP